MKYTILFLMLFVVLQSCGQENESINKKNIETLELKKYESEPIHYINLNTTYGYDILINGFPISRHSYINGTFTVPINNYLYESGIQNIEIKIVPMYYENGEQDSLLGKDGYFELEIEQREWTKENTLKEPKIIYSYKLSVDENYNKTIVIHSDSFTANIPYKLIDWTEGKIFKEEDSLILKEKVLKYYEKLKYSFENQDGKGYVEAINKGLNNIYQGNYFSEEKSIESTNKKIDFISRKKRKLEPIENYKLQISGGGKLLSLRRTDGFNAGEGVLRRWYTKNGRKVLKIEDIVFYSPRTPQVDDYNLEVIWYMNFEKGVNQ